MRILHLQATKRARYRLYKTKSDGVIRENTRKVISTMLWSMHENVGMKYRGNNVQV